jgi:alanine dehydrogenase
VDVIEQCIHVGELHHAVDYRMKVQDVYAELCEVVSGRKPERTGRYEIVIFDASGTPFQDVATAVAVYEKALDVGRGETFDFSS